MKLALLHCMARRLDGARTVCSSALLPGLTVVGGSLRIPAHYSGIYAIKPVQGRLPILGTFKAVPGFEAIKVGSHL